MKIMAKRIINWKNEGSTLFCGKVSEIVDFTHSFNLEEVYPKFNEYTPVQMVLAQKKWEDMKAGRVSAERANGTGAAENKQIASTMKAAMKEVTLQGLLVKQLLTPSLFSEEDNVKLQEFLIEAGKLASRNTAEVKSKK